MAISDLNDGVGKKIVEALKMQSAAHGDGEVFVNDDTPEIIEETVVEETPVEVSDDFEENSYYETQVPSDMQMRIQSQLQYQAATQPQTFVDAAFQQSLVQNLGMNAFASEDDFD